MKRQTHKKLRPILIFKITLLLVGCAVKSGVQYDYNKQNIFKDQFTPGMSFEEVESILDQLEGVTLIDKYTLSNGEVVFKYSTPEEKYGSFQYAFQYSSDLNLIKVIAGELTD